jgi:DNA-binding transcriptional MerR regulator
MARARVQKKLYYKIGEACKRLGIQPYVLRYWETEFPALAPSKSRSGQRVYSEKELEVIQRIKELLYGEGYTIAGAKKRLETELAEGELGPLQEVETAAEEAPPKAPGRARAERGNGAEPAGEAAPETAPAEAAALDTGAAERIQTLRSGIDRALREAREILALLEKSP